MIPELELQIASVCLVTVLANIQRIVVNVQLMGPLKNREKFPQAGAGIQQNLENNGYSHRTMPMNSLS